MNVRVIRLQQALHKYLQNVKVFCKLQDASRILAIYIPSAVRSMLHLCAVATDVLICLSQWTGSP